MAGVTRRRFLQSGAAVVAGATVLGARAPWAVAGPRGAAARTVPLRTDWRFGRLVPGATDPAFDDSGLPRVTLPHSVAELSWQDWDAGSWEADWIYRRRFDLPDDLSGLRVFLDFAGALTAAAPTLNGTALEPHQGGYLPFGYEVTDLLSANGNVLAVALDGRELRNVPPNVGGGGAGGTDYLQPAGLYRDVSLRAVPPTFVADVFATPVDVLDSARRVDVQCTIDAAETGTVEVEAALLRDGCVIARDAAPVAIDAPGRRTVALQLTGLGDLALWDVEHPELYDVVTTLSVGGRPVHDHRARIGFRHAHFAVDGFFLNGERLKVFGLNRHQIYPYAGMAVAARVQRRDAEILRRELNCNMVRCSHYPQAAAFLDACDELGLLVWEEIPSFNNLGNAAWEELTVRDTRDMVLRDRNRPSIVLWGVQVNHSPVNLDLYRRTREVAETLDGSRQTVGAHDYAWRTKHDYRTEFVQDVFGQHNTPSATLLPPTDGVPYLIDEAVGSQAGSPLFRRTDPLEVQQEQARLHALAHEQAAADDRFSGVLAWSAFDYDSLDGGIKSYRHVKYNGVADTFRIPKPGAAIYRAQVDPAIRPVIEPAFHWDFGPQSPPRGPGADAMICSNCDRLELFVGGEHIATVEPDRERFGHLAYPPSFADLDVDGSARPDLRIDGYAGGRQVLSRSFAGDPAGDRLVVVADDAELVADGADATRVVFRAVDRYGAPRAYPGGEVTVELDGPATLVGDNPFAFADAGGAGAIWIRTRHGAAGAVRLRASHPALGSGEVTVRVRPVGGAAEAAVDLSLAAAPALVRGGTPARVTATVANLSHPALEDARLTLSVPPGWTVEAVTPTAFAAVRPGQRVSPAWDVTPPDGAAPGDAAVTVRVGYRAAGRAQSDAASVALVVPSTFEAALDNAGASDDADVTAADFDGSGNSYSRQALAAAGLAPGARVEHGGLAFAWPSAPAGEPDNVLCNGQSIALSGAGSRLAFLGATSNGPITGAGTVHYADGMRADFALALDDYFLAPGEGKNDPASGNEAVAHMAYVNASTKKGDGGRPGRRTHDAYVFFAAVPVEPKPLAGVTLPRVGSTVVGVPDMHVFAIAVG